MNTRDKLIKVYMKQTHVKMKSKETIFKEILDLNERYYIEASTPKWDQEYAGLLLDRKRALEWVLGLNS